MTPPILYIVAVEHHGITSYHASTTPLVRSRKFISYHHHKLEIIGLQDQIIKLKKMIPKGVQDEVG